MAWNLLPLEGETMKPSYRLHVRATYEFDFPVVAESEEKAKEMFDDISEEELMCFIEDDVLDFELMKVELDKENI